MQVLEEDLLSSEREAMIMVKKAGRKAGDVPKITGDADPNTGRPVPLQLFSGCNKISGLESDLGRANS